MDTIVALYENLAIAYYVLLNLKQGGCETSAIGFVMEEKRQRSSKDRAERPAETMGIAIDDDSSIRDLTELLPGAETIRLSHNFDLLAAGPVAVMLKQAVDAAIRVAVDPVPAALMATLIQMRLSDGEVDTFTEGILNGKVLVLVNVDRSTRDRAVSITNAFLPVQINTLSTVKQQRYSQPQQRQAEAS